MLLHELKTYLQATNINYRIKGQYKFLKITLKKHWLHTDIIHKQQKIAELFNCELYDAIHNKEKVLLVLR